MEDGCRERGGVVPYGSIRRVCRGPGMHIRQRWHRPAARAVVVSRSRFARRGSAPNAITRRLGLRATPSKASPYPRPARRSASSPVFAPECVSAELDLQRRRRSLRHDRHHGEPHRGGPKVLPPATNQPRDKHPPAERQHKPMRPAQRPPLRVYNLPPRGYKWGYY